MAILADLIYRDIQLKDAYVKIIDIWGSKTGWNALVGVAVNKDAADRKSYLYTFNVGEMITSNPYQLYNKIAEKFTNDGINWNSDEVVIVAAPKKRVKKNATI